jgi:hypothetical protein
VSARSRTFTALFKCALRRTRARHFVRAVLWRCRKAWLQPLARRGLLALTLRFMESLLSLLRMHRDDELISVGRARLRRALIFVAPKEFQGSTESRPTLRFRERIGRRRRPGSHDAGSMMQAL